MIDLSNIQARDPLRAEHEQLIAEFLARGGAIQELYHIERAPVKPATWNGSVTPDPAKRKEFLRREREIAEHGRTLAAIGLTVQQALRQMRKRWGKEITLNAPRLEQLAARFGFAFVVEGRGRP